MRLASPRTPALRARRRPALAALPRAAVGLLLVLGALAAAPVASAQSWVVAPASDNAGLISQLFWFTLVLAGVVFVLVEGLLIYSSLRFRRRAPVPAREPPQIHGNTRLEVMWAIVPALILIGLFGITVSRLGVLGSIPEGDPNAIRITATGQQFAWQFGYPDAGVTVTNELRVPVGKPVVMEVTSKDVIHSFWVPNLHGKIDANPGRLNRIWFTPQTSGTFRGVCAELCGAGHANMLFRVQALPVDQFEQWLEEQRNGGGGTSEPSGGAGGDLAQQGQRVLGQLACVGCHTIPGVQGANGNVGPNLAGVASRTRIAGGVVPNNGPDDLKRWIQNPPAMKPGTIMPPQGLSDDQLNAVVAYLETLK